MRNERVNATESWVIKVERKATCCRSTIRVYSWWTKGDAKSLPVRVRYEITGNKLNIGSLWTRDWTVEEAWDRAVLAMRRERPRATIHPIQLG